MSRVTAPVSKLSRSIASTPASRASPLLDSTAHNAGAVLMPKYAELLRNKPSEPADPSRGLTTAHRPAPQPSLANRSKPLMQTFSSAAPSASAAAPFDAVVLPSMAEPAAPEAAPRVPMLPGNVAAAPHAETSPGPPAAAEAAAPAIVAVNPDNVLPSAPLSEVEGVGLDTVELKFVHELPAEEQQRDEGSMIGDLWRGMVDDMLGPAAPKKA